jgi:DNA-binding transcriptional regulator WhiA
MRVVKRRLSASVDADLLAAVEAAAKQAEIANVSAWVNEALRLKLEHDQALAQFGNVITDFEAEHGEITNDEIEGAVRKARAEATAVRGTRASEKQTRWRRPAAGGKRRT